MRWITTTYLRQWADQRDSQGTVPLLVRRLIRATIGTIDKIQFPAGDAVYTRGWDGELQCKSATEFIPLGDSYWEFSSEQKIGTKVEEDYSKRSDKTPKNIRKSSTYVFVTPRKWDGKKDWIKKKQEEDKWADVRLYDAVDLEDWIEQAPAVGSWLSKEIGRSSDYGVLSAIDYWNEWENNTRPPLIPEVVIAGRQEQNDKIIEWFKGPASKLDLKAFSIEESIAFLLAVTDTSDNSLKDDFFSRCIIVKTVEAFRELIYNRSHLILIKDFDDEAPIGTATQRGHYVYVPVSPENTSNPEALSLPRLGLNEFINALMKMGLSEDVANSLSKETGRSLTVLRRKIGIDKIQPVWVISRAIDVLIPILMFGRWSEKSDRDKDVLSKIYGDSYDNYISQLNRWLYATDSPIMKIGNSWRLISPYDAFYLLSPYITKQKLDKFREIVIEVLSTYNPVLDIEPDKRYMASILGKKPEFSGWIREGVAQFLILTALYGKDTITNSISNSQGWVDNVIGEILEKADGKRWNSLSEVLPLIAEASPKVFVDAVAKSLSAENKPVMDMFINTDNPLFFSSPHTNILWALEGIAWNPEMLGQVTLILGQMADLDPDTDSNQVNRPLNSLIDIYRHWYLQTFANVKQRMACIDLLLKHNDQIGWELLIKLLPTNQGTAMNTHRPRWRKDKDDFNRRPSMQEEIEFVTFIVDRILININSNGAKWSQVISNFNNLPMGEKVKIVNILEQDINNVTEDTQILRNEIRSLLSRHKSFKDHGWALPGQMLSKFDLFYNKLEPKDLINRYSWLFDSDYPDIPEGLDFEEPNKKTDKIEEYRINALKTIFDKSDYKDIIKLVENVKFPWIVGIITGTTIVNDSELEKEIHLCLNSDSQDKINYFARGYVNQKYSIDGINYVRETSSISIINKWPNNMVLSFFFALPEKIEIWKELEKHNNDVMKVYWERCLARFYFSDKESIEYGVSKLKEANRPYAALEILSHTKNEIDLNTLYSTAERIITSECIEIDKNRIHEYDISKVLEKLDRGSFEKAKIALLEWHFLPILSSHYSKRPPKYLHEEMADSPEFFSEIVRWTFKPEEDFDEKEETLTKEQIMNRVRNGLDLLKSWRSVPGLQKDGSIDKDHLINWLRESQRICLQNHREKVCDICIGELLSSLIKEKDNKIEIHSILGDLLEEVVNDNIEHGIFIGVLNQRSTTVRGAFEGGKPEYKLRDLYQEYSDRLNTQFPRLVKVLKDLSEYYEIMAKREDEESNRREMEY
ncbi:hypothetical protein KJ762_07935 [bacterium]|nr:hypothetical protein [bacterium]MBU1634422.1 hypothetical protein [bacterium]MBU1873946.1 hypothetical protein [bacterium]